MDNLSNVKLYKKILLYSSVSASYYPVEILEKTFKVPSLHAKEFARDLEEKYCKEYSFGDISPDSNGIEYFVIIS